MKAILKLGPEPGACQADLPDPEPPVSNQVLVRVKASSICGTDFHVYSWDAWSASRVRPPRVMGHEFAGEVVAVGSEVEALQPGDYVSGESHWVCGVCLQCRAGQGHVCEKTRILGIDVDGCFAEYVTVPEASLWKNDLSLPPEIACIQDPLGNAIHATLAGEVAGQSVVVLGCGPIGVFAVAVARAAGASAVIATDTKPFRTELARKLGATAALDARTEDIEKSVLNATNGRGADVVLEMSGAPQAIVQAARLSRPGGRISLMGIPTQNVEMPIAEMIFKGLDIQCIVGRRLYQTWQTMSGLLLSGALDVRPAITHELEFGEIDHGMALMRDGLCGKVVFRHP